MSKEQIANWCRHFNGTQNDTCKAGIRYEDVRDGLAHKTYPCFKENGRADQCPSASFLSEQEVDAEMERIAIAAGAFFTKLAEGKVCPHCNAPIAKRLQVGRCVYARPCGHRQYQGKLPDEEA